MSDKGKIDELNDSLYSRNFRKPEEKREVLDQVESLEVDETFNSPSIDEMLKHDRRKNVNSPIMKKLFTFALLFFIAAAAVAGYVYLGGNNLISSKNVDIKIQGPISIAAGSPAELGITISNKNNADLSVVNMVVEYPEGTREATDVTEPLTRNKVSLGVIKAGTSVTKNFQSVLFGEKGEVKTITINIEYQVKGSNAIFTKDKTYDIQIGSSPVTMTIEKPPTISSGETFTTTITLLANSSEVLKNIAVRGEFPYGFSVESSTPLARVSNNVWLLGDLAPGDKKEITLKGVLTGENQEERTFRFYAGIASQDDPSVFDAPLALVSETIGISRSALGLRVALNGDTDGTYTAPAGKIVTGSIKYQNNSPETVENAKIEIKLSGTVLDKNSIAPLNGGFYNSLDNTISWNKGNLPELGRLSPGDSGQVSFNFSSASSIPSNIRNPEISLATMLSGSSDSGAPLNLKATSVNSLKIASEVSLSLRSLYSRGPFTNTGPVPPKAEKATTYTVVVDVGNTRNEITNTKVVMSLGPNVKWLSKVNGDNVVYDENSNLITWNIGALPSGAGFSTAGKEISFQVSITPSLGQVGSVPVLVQNISLKGTDAFAGQEVNITKPAITTLISTDPKYVQGDEVVAK